MHESQERGEGGCEIALRRATEADIERILDVQQPGALKGLGNTFPQDQHPFPRARVADRWRMEIADAETAVYVATSAGGPVLGFAARRQDELLHFGTAVETWGAGFARWLHDELLRIYPPAVTRVRLRVFAENLRARRFYEKCGWTQTGVTSRTQSEPYPLLIEYVRRRG